jgi:hypothetical protein
MNEIVGFDRNRGWFVALAFVAACGLDVVGVDPLASDGAGVPSSRPGCECSGLDPKWRPVAVAIGPATAACPSGGTSEVLRTNPEAGPDACACKATETVAPVCNKGNVTFKIGSGCTSTGVVTLSSEASCHRVDGSLASSVGFDQLAPSGGSCVAVSAPDASKVTSDVLTMCAPSCAADLCAKKAPAGFRACVVAEGDVACDLPGFSEKHLAGTTTSLSCGACTGCTATATCTNVSIDLYSSSSCGTKVFNLPANACTPTGAQSGASVGGMIYNATVTPAYNAPPSAGSASVVGAKTVCCAP